jgi:hypothetical protein
MGKMLLGIAILGLLGSCNNKKLISDCENYKVTDKYERKEIFITNQYAGKINSSPLYIPVPQTSVYYYITFENNNTYSIGQSKYRLVNVGEKIKECKF